MKTKLFLFGVCVLSIILSACNSPQQGAGSSTAIVGTAEVISSTAVGSTGGGSLTGQPPSTPGPATVISPLPSGATPTALKYRVLDEYPKLFFCDPDYYPVARADEAALAVQRFPEMQANAEEFAAILEHNAMAGITAFTDEQKLLIYREHKKLAAIQFEIAGNKYQFQLQISEDGNNGFRISGTIDAKGRIKEEQRDAGFTMCPICLAAHTLIDTPRGQIAVEDLHVGDPVWTVDARGVRQAAVILQTVRTFVPAWHKVVHIILADGRELFASPGHPTADGRTLGDLKVGDMLNGARVVFIERVRYDQPATYDLLPSGETGYYWADGILIGSTLTNP